MTQIDTINWSRLKSYKSSKSKSFEQMCFQIANILYEDKGEFWPIDDSGGGDGVEFFLILKSLSEWGWQAKFYDGNGRLTDSRKSKIVDSLKQSLQKHSKLSHWILCTNSDFTPTERKWFRDVLPKTLPKNKKVKLTHWGHSELHKYLNQPRFNGLKNNFFNDLELTSEWFKSTFHKFFQAVQNKYEEDLHTQDSTLVYDYIGPLLASEDFKNRLGSYIGSLKKQFEDFKKDINEIKSLNLKEIEWESVRNDYVKVLQSFIPECERIIKHLEEDEKKISPNDITQVINRNYQPFIQSLQTIIDKAKIIKNTKRIQFKEGFAPDLYSDKYRLNNASRLIHSPSYHADKIIGEIGYFYSHSEMANQHHLHILADAGIGKTHLCVNMAKGNIDNGIPAIFIPANKFSESSNIEGQILELLDIKSSYSLKDFFDTIESIGKVHNCRIPIIIDGLNESVNENGGFNKRWRLDLDGLESQINQYQNIVLITTCRTSYKKALGWENRDYNTNVHTLYGFINSSDVKELVTKYFNKYKIIAEITFLSLEQFSKPLLLKIFCETKNPNREKEVIVMLGRDSIYDCLAEFIKQCDKNIYKRITEVFNFPPKSDLKNLASRILPTIGRELWNKNSRGISLDEYIKIVDGNDEANYEKSKSKALQDEGLLFVRDWYGEEEHVGFTYELLGGYIIADYLINENKNIEEFIKSEEFYNRLLTEDYELKHPYHENILQCFIALLPVKKGVYYHELVPQIQKYNNSSYESIRSLFSISNHYINKNQKEIVSRLFEREQNRTYLLNDAVETFFVNDHAFNFNFWADKLFGLPMLQRDILWSEYLRGKGEEYFYELLGEFEKICRSDSPLTDVVKSRIHLVAKYLMWVLTSTVVQLRDKATKCLYWYGRLFPEDFVLLLKTSVTINDPYVFERMAAACYGISMAKRFDLKSRNFADNILPKIGTFLFQNVFGKDAKYSTTHILTREYVFNTINLALQHYPNLLSKIEKKRLSQPFNEGGIRKWKVSRDKNEKEYRDGNSLIDYFFEDKKIPILVNGDKYKPNDNYKRVIGNIRWRAYQLGYQFKAFESIDKSIANFKHYNNEYWASTRKYGEKYSLIAYYELAGYMYDIGTINKSYGLNDKRFETFDIDPSFPEDSEYKQLVTKDLIGNRKISTIKWLSDVSIPDVNEFLSVKNLLGNKGEWMMLYGSIDQLDKKTERNIAIYLDAVIIRNDSSTLSILKQKIDTHDDIIPDDYSLFKDESPVSPEFSHNGFSLWDYIKESKKEKVKYVKERLFKNGRMLTKSQEEIFWKKIESEYNVIKVRPTRSIKGMPNISLLIIERSQIDPKSNYKRKKFVLENELKKAGLKIKEVTSIEIENKDIYDKIEVFIPQKRIKNSIVLAKELTDFFELINQPQCNDLFEKNGNKASTYFRFGEGYRNIQQFHFIRKDLLDKYLKKMNLKMAWMIRGERQYYPETDLMMKRHKILGREPFTYFQNVVEYNSEKSKMKRK